MEASLRSGPFAAAMAKIDGAPTAASDASASGKAAPAAAPAASSKPKTSMPPPPPRQQLATAKSNVGSAGASRFGTLSFKPTGAAARGSGGSGAASGAPLPR